ncbi:DUF6476 family protein [Rhodovulum sp. DZ06]|uniref:DUF6476 family protein n=1 Tax=Rhodovulum sp. DZ06 TaxID=3425126 RepID=UPI003D355553
MSGTIDRRGPEDEDEFIEPPRLRALRLMVMALLGVMMIGIAVIAITIAMRLGSFTGAVAPAPVEAVALPAGFEVQALGGEGPNLLALGRDASGAELLLVIRKSDGAELSRTKVERR